MLLKVSRKRSFELQFGASAARVFGDLYDRERRVLVKGGHAEPTAADIERLAAAEAKRQRKAAKRAAQA